MSSIIIRLVVEATDTPKYERVVFGTYEAKFEIDEFLKSPTNTIEWRQQINQEAGITNGGRLGLLEYVEVIPHMRFTLPAEDMLRILKEEI